MHSHLLVAMGQKIYLWSWHDNDTLDGLSFVDMSYYIHHMVSVNIALNHIAYSEHL